MYLDYPRRTTTNSCHSGNTYEDVLFLWGRWNIRIFCMIHAAFRALLLLFHFFTFVSKFFKISQFSPYVTCANLCEFWCIDKGQKWLLGRIIIKKKTTFIIASSPAGWCSSLTLTLIRKNTTITLLLIIIGLLFSQDDASRLPIANRNHKTVQINLEMLTGTYKAAKLEHLRTFTFHSVNK